jgi:hypothetical protein
MNTKPFNDGYAHIKTGVRFFGLDETVDRFWATEDQLYKLYIDEEDLKQFMDGAIAAIFHFREQAA